jgi:hypothetical protein
MTYEINGTVMSLSALIASSSETLDRVLQELGTALSREAALDVPPPPGAALLLDNLRAALSSIGPVLNGSSMLNVCPPTAAEYLDEAAHMIAGAAMATGKARTAIAGQQAPLHVFPATAGPVSPSQPGRNPEDPVMADDINSAAGPLSELIAASSRALYRIQYGLNRRGPGHPVADTLGAADMLDRLSSGLTYIARAINDSCMPGSWPFTARPHLDDAANLSGRALVRIRKAHKAIAGPDQRGRPLVDFPGTVASRGQGRPMAPRRAAGQVSRPPAGRAP